MQDDQSSLLCELLPVRHGTLFQPPGVIKPKTRHWQLHLPEKKRFASKLVPICQLEFKEEERIPPLRSGMIFSRIVDKVCKTGAATAKGTFVLQ
jgi:hypothetical protein